MKLCRYGKNGFEKPGIIDSEGKLRDLSEVVEGWILVRVSRGLTIPKLGRASIRVKKAS